MLCTKVLGNIHSCDEEKRIIKIPVEWYETHKRVLRKIAEDGEEIGIRLEQNESLNEGDILFEDGSSAYVIDIIPCEAIRLSPDSMAQMARAAFEIGNQHKPLFVKDDKLYVAYDKPLFELLHNKHLHPEITIAKLTGEVACHGHEH